MAITMQGTWTVSVKSKNASFPQRFIISGATSGNGTYVGAVATPAVLVTGAHWSITIQNNPGAGFINSADQITFPTTSAGQHHFDIQSNDAGGDSDFNDLVLMCSTPASATEFLIYGHVSYYSGYCWFNPCHLPWIVIDTHIGLARALENPTLKAAIEKIYPERVIPIPPPPPGPPINPAKFSPLVIPLREPTALPARLAQQFKLAPEASGESAAKSKRAEAASTPTLLRTLAVSQQSSLTLDIDRASLATIVDRFRPRCETGSLSGVVLGFQEYDRTNAELGGAAYTGAGNREDLGFCATDRNGNYIFRFSRSIAQFIDEATTDVASGENVFTQAMPDVIAQYLDFGRSSAPCHESAPYWNVPNLKQINICVPKECVGRIPSACQGHNAIQAIGNIFIGDVQAGYVAPFGAPPGYGPRVGLGNFLGGTGRITAKNPLVDVPQARCAAWINYLDFFACFLDHPNVKYYTIRHRKHQLPFLGWNFFQEKYTHPFIAHLGIPGYTGDLVGPQAGVQLHIDGGPKVDAPAYLNIESDGAWLFTHRDRKGIITSWLYAAAPGPVDFRIEGYDAAGNKVAGADDTITLFIEHTSYNDGDSKHLSYNIQQVSLMGSTVVPCSLITLPPGHASDPLTVKFKAEQPQGFMSSYALSVSRCGGGLTTERKSGGKIADAYVHGDDLACNELQGTPDDPVADGNGVVAVDVGPILGQTWLPGSPSFGIFNVSLDCATRVTNGYNTATLTYPTTTVSFALQQ